MRDLFAKCGFNCGHCAAYKENAKTDDDRQRGSEGWKKYFGFQMRPDRMYCDGCQTPDDRNPVLLARSCAIRKCAMMNGVETCAHCSAFRVCMHDLRIHEADVDRKKMEAELGMLIPEEDYTAFIRPHEHLKNLDRIRASLDPKHTVKPKVSVLKATLVDFPDDLPLTSRQISAFKALHGVLADIVSISGTTYAQQVILKKRRQYSLKLLWTFGLFGTLLRKGGWHLAIDGQTYLGQKLPGNFDRMLLHFQMLKKLGVLCEHVPLTKDKYGEKGWLTPMGWLRKKGWFIKLSFDDVVGGASTLKALTNYVTKLNQKYGKRAFGYFAKADMRILVKKGR